MTGPDRAGAQTTIELVSNSGQSRPTGFRFVGSNDIETGLAQAFTTGPSAAGYNLDDVRIDIRAKTGIQPGTALTVHVYTVSSNRPGTQVHTLTSPSALAFNLNTFTALSGAILAGKTRYMLAFAGTADNDNDIGLAITTSDSEDTSSLPGWEIEDAVRVDGALLATASLRIEVRGSIINTAPTGSPTIAQEGLTLVADIAGIADADGLENATYEYQWIEVDGTTDTDITNATDRTYTVTPADEGKTIKVKVTFTDAAGSDEELTSATKTVQVPPETPTNLTAQAVAPIRIHLDWEGSIPSLKDLDHENPPGYRIEWSADGNAPWTSLVNVRNQYGEFEIWCACYGTQFNDNTIAPGTTRYYRIQAVDKQGSMSDFSGVVSATTPGLVDSGNERIAFGVVDSEFDALNDQKVFRVRLASGAYWFTVWGEASKHRVIVTDTAGTEIENFVQESTKDLGQRITAQSSEAHQVKISHGGTLGNAGSLNAGSFRFALLPVRQDAAATLRLPGTPSLSPILNTYGDLDSWGVAVQPGKAYAVRVWGRETNSGTAATPRIKRARPPSTTHVYNMGQPWVDGVTIAKRSPICPKAKFAEPEKCEYQAFVIDLRGQTGAEQTWRIDVATTARPRTRPYLVGTYDVDLRELSSSELQGVRMPLRAWFASQSAQHDGSKRIKVRVGFSDAVAESPEHGVKVEGGAVTSVRPVDGNAPGGAAAASATTRSVGGQDGEVVWEFEIEPDSDGDVAVSLEAWRPCEETGAICTADGRLLSQGISTTVRGPDEASAPLTASFESMPEAHDGESAFTFRVAFSEDIGISYRSLREDAFTVTSGHVTRGERVDDRRDLFEMTVQPDSDGDVTIALEGGRDCATSGAICTKGDNRRQLTNSPTATVAGPAAEPLTARFENMPAEHDGQGEFQFRVAFSEDIGSSLRSLREDAFTVTGVRVTGGKRVDDRRDLFEITVQPDSDDDVTITLPAGRECSVSGAICTKGEPRRQLTNSPSATVAGPSDDAPEPNTPATGAPAISGTPQVGEALSASTSGISDADGLDDARFAYQWIRADSDIQGATGSTYTAVEADEGERLKVRVSFTDDAGNEESLTSAATDAVAARPVPLTASFEGMPAEHAAKGSFSFRVAFSEGIKVGYKTVRDASFRVTGGEVTKASRVDKRRDLWKIIVAPDSNEAVRIRLPETTDCGASGAICTGDGRPLSHSLSATVAGPVGIAVADARVEEGDGAVLAFLVTLSRAASGTLAVDYATEDGSAHAGDDYTAASGRLKFRAGQSSKKIKVGVLDDSHDEGEETLTLRLSNASSGEVTDGEATGTIKNSDPLPRALLARFGRAAAVQVVEQVEERLEASREPGFRGRVAGRELRRGMERDIGLDLIRRLGGAAGVGLGVAGVGASGAAGSMGGAGPMGGAAGSMGGAGPMGGGAGSMGMAGPMGGGAGSMGMAGPMGGGAGSMGMAGPMGGGAGSMGMAADGGDGWLNGRGLLEMGLGGGDVLTGSAFALNRETGGGGVVSLWSRGARSRFSGREGALSLGGDVRTTMFGADYARGPLVVGLSLSDTRGLGEYSGPGAGRMLSSVTGLYPWLGYRATDRITVWGVTGYGVGGMLLTPAGGPALESGLTTAMAAAGTRGELVGGGADGFALAFKADVLWAGTAIDGADGPEGRLAATAAAVTRVRTGLEGSRGFTFGGGLSLRPSVEVGLRHDGGDAETGAGVDVGGGLVASHASSGLAADVRVRTLLVHEAEGFREHGVSLSLSWNPTPSTPLGLTARVAPSWGGQATGGADALWGRETMAGMGAHGGLASGNRLDGEVGYGLPVGRRFVGTPRVGFSTSEYGQDYRVGYGLGVLDRGSLNFELGVEAQRRNSPMLGGASDGVLGRAMLGW